LPGEKKKGGQTRVWKGGGVLDHLEKSGKKRRMSRMIGSEKKGKAVIWWKGDECGV